MQPVFFFVFWVINYLIIYLFNLLSPTQIFLGSYRLGPIEASVFSAFWITFFVWTLWEYLRVREVKYDPPELFFVYSLFVNILGFWLVSRYSEYSGLGLESVGWVVTLAAVSSVIQSYTLQKLDKKN